MLKPEFKAAPVFIMFHGGPSSDEHPCRVLGPFASIEQRGMGIWAYPAEAHLQPLRIATQAKGSIRWELDGFDDRLWGQFHIFCPPPGTSARQIEAHHGWVNPPQ